jgi:hypothetical protein
VTLSLASSSCWIMSRKSLLRDALQHPETPIGSSLKAAAGSNHSSWSSNDRGGSSRLPVAESRMVWETFGLCQFFGQRRVIASFLRFRCLWDWVDIKKGEARSRSNPYQPATETATPTD